VTQPWAPHCVVAKAANKQAEIRIYPPYGNSPSEAHSFAYRGAGIWIDGVVRFLDVVGADAAQAALFAKCEFSWSSGRPP
jgi:hypothetical protein